MTQYNDFGEPEPDYSWEKPAWTQKQLKSTGKNVKAGENLAAPITDLPHVGNKNSGVNEEVQPDSVVKNKGIQGEEKNLDWEKPSWTKNAGLKSTGKGSDMKAQGNLAKPITALPHMQTRN